MEVLSNTNAGWAMYCEKIEKENEALQMKYLKGSLLAVVVSSLSERGGWPLSPAVVRIQNWVRRD